VSTSRKGNAREEVPGAISIVIALVIYTGYKVLSIPIAPVGKI
jgi:hypothetical protein